MTITSVLPMGSPLKLNDTYFRPLTQIQTFLDDLNAHSDKHEKYNLS